MKLVLIVVTLLPTQGAPAPVSSIQPSRAVGVPGAEVMRLAREVRDADLRADWLGLVRAHDALASLRVPAGERPWVDYYLGYADWRRASLAWMGEGPAAFTALMERTGEHLTRALDAEPGLTEARVILAMVQGALMANPQRAAALAPSLVANMNRAEADAPSNPRVRLMRSMLSYFNPASSAAAKDSALSGWEQAARSFPERSAPGEPEWGRAEAWAWLGGALLVAGDSARARAALERALADRPDFWWARDIALPQARHSRLIHRDRNP